MTSVFDVSGNVKLTGTIPSSLSHLSASNFGGLCLSGTAAASSGCGSSSSLSRSSLAAAIAVPIGVVVLGVAVVTVFVLVQRQGRGHRAAVYGGSASSLVPSGDTGNDASVFLSSKQPSDRGSDGSGSGSHRLVHVSPLDRDAAAISDAYVSADLVSASAAALSDPHSVPVHESRVGGSIATGV